ncbi:MAG: hypothetical protein KF749_08015 [Bacteroidetes bacterium]|nr:hypothetical protein [Bacteroidota bacterium]MCW5894914.1 hypothetical protein [Bacteroidota bacterium]
MKRTLLILLLSAGMMTIGFIAGGLIAAKLVVSSGDGLAGGATVAVYGIAGALIGLAGGILLGRRLQTKPLTVATVFAMATGVASIFFLIRTSTVTTQRAHEEAIAALPERDSNGVTIPPAVPAKGTPDSLLALVTAPPDSLPHYETKEYEYEESGITVYGSYYEWYLVGRPDGGRAWLRAQSVGRFMHLEQLIPNRLNYLTEAWDGQLRDAPSIGVAARPVPITRGRETPANVLEARRDETTLWFRVEILAESPCEGGMPGVVATGWIPAWGTGHKVTAWFYSRGC